MLLLAHAIARRLPLIVCAEVLDEVNVDEHPALPRFGSWNLPRLGLAEQGYRMNSEKVRGFLERKGSCFVLGGSVTA
jgi:hypothetical protein